MTGKQRWFATVCESRIRAADVPPRNTNMYYVHAAEQA
jgi:hypothetical protein